MINRWERELILSYDYQFEDIERELRESGDSDLERVTDGFYSWEKVIINLRISEEEKSEV